MRMTANCQVWCSVGFCSRTNFIHTVQNDKKTVRGWKKWKGGTVLMASDISTTKIKLSKKMKQHGIVAMSRLHTQQHLDECVSQWRRVETLD